VVVVGSVVRVVVGVGRVVGVVRGGDVTGDGGARAGAGGATNGAAAVVVVVRARRDRWSRAWRGAVVDEVSAATAGVTAAGVFVVVVVVAAREVGTVALTRSAFTSVEPARGSVPMRQTPTTMSASATKSSRALRN
jgi:hypothetical protein